MSKMSSRFEIQEVLNGKHVKSTKKGKILSSYTENTVYCSDDYNLAQKLDNSVQIVRISGHALRRKVVWVGELSLAKSLQGRRGNPLARVTL